ncbi:MAG: hypothetical protein KDB01_21655 [Planctomycetaceae bacterium]|nr:hypothetical protein [Planctomycetaceae bacterium]
MTIRFDQISREPFIGSKAIYTLILMMLGGLQGIFIGRAECADGLKTLTTVLENTDPLSEPRGGRLPMYILPISDYLKGLSDSETETQLRALEARGIGYTVDWQPAQYEASAAEALRIARLQQKIGQPVAINATACLHAFCDGSAETLHVDAEGHRFADDSCGSSLGCPFALNHRIPVIREQVEKFVRAYQNAGQSIDFIFADWEVDGPIEWNDTRRSAQKCISCQRHVQQLNDFRHYQTALRRIRSTLQREAFAMPITQAFPQALVGNYGVNPHDGYRYWYDYFEHPAGEDMPFLADRKARYREWYPEFAETNYTFAMPVVYTWYPTFDWYDFESTDFRWLYNMLKESSSVGRNTPASTPIIPFVHWHTTAPPQNPRPDVKQMSPQAYQDLLWHMLLRGHDTFFLWCLADELATEVRLVHQVYRESMLYSGFLSRGEPITFDVPPQPSTVISGLRLGNSVLIRRSEYAPTSGPMSPVKLRLGDDSEQSIEIPPGVGNQIVTTQANAEESHAPKLPLLLQRGSDALFPIGCYELPADDAALKEMAEAGINLIRCGNRGDLDRVHAVNALGWIPMSVQQGATDELRKRVAALVDHPALAVWEGPDEIIWNFTAYSGLLKSAGITKEDWYEQRPNAVAYAESQAAIILPKMREGIALIKSLDPHQRPFWMNEAADSDLRYTRGYVNSVQCLGCDYYPVRGNVEYDLRSIGQMVDRWAAVGRDKPVWMVLQAFSWHTMFPERGVRYPTFAESRYMAYSAIAHGAQGILYWGSTEIQDPAFRQSIYALTSELATLQPFLTRQPMPHARAVVVRDLFEPPGAGVRIDVRAHGDELLVILVNEDNHRHLGVDVQGLKLGDGRKLFELYGPDEVTVENEGFALRMRPLESRIYCTTRDFEAQRVAGRQYVSPR